MHIVAHLPIVSPVPALVPMTRRRACGLGVVAVQNGFLIPEKVMVVSVGCGTMGRAALPADDAALSRARGSATTYVRQGAGS